jgi:serine/threonine protein kinase
VVYVDDFKLAGPTKSLSEGWQLIRKKVRMEEPTPLGKYLGCGHTVFTTTLDLTTKHAIYRWPPNMSNPVVSPRRASSANNDEYIGEGNFTEKSETWSLGCCLYYLVTKMDPFEG